MDKRKSIPIVITVAILFFAALFFGIRAAFPRRYGNAAQQSGVEPSLVYAVMKAESGFDEHAKSRAGAIGLMQLKPSTAEFICGRFNIPFEASRLEEGEYNAILGCTYLKYLIDKFEITETALAAYNAGEGTVSKWLEEKAYSDDGKRLKSIPYKETRQYVKKVLRCRKIYEILYR